MKAKKPTLLVSFYEEFWDLKSSNGQLSWLVYLLNLYGNSDFNFILVGLDTGIYNKLKNVISDPKLKSVTILDLSKFGPKKIIANHLHTAEYHILKKPLQHFVLNDGWITRWNKHNQIKLAFDKKHLEKIAYYSIAWKKIIDEYDIDYMVGVLDALGIYTVLYQICQNEKIPIYVDSGERIKGYFNFFLTDSSNFFQIPRFNALYKSTIDSYQKNKLSKKQISNIKKTSLPIKTRIKKREKPFKLTPYQGKVMSYGLLKKAKNLFIRLKDYNFQPRAIFNTAQSIFDFYEGLDFYKNKFFTDLEISKATNFYLSLVKPKLEFEKIIKNNKYVLLTLPYISEAHNIVPFPNFNHLEIITDLAQACPSDMKIVVKDHPLQQGKFNLRQFKNIYNHYQNKIEICHYDADLKSLISNAEFVAGTNNTSLYEAINLGKTIISYGNDFFVEKEFGYRVKLGEVDKLSQILMYGKKNFDPFYVDILNYSFIKSIHKFERFYNLNVLPEKILHEQLIGMRDIYRKEFLK